MRGALKGGRASLLQRCHAGLCLRCCGKGLLGGGGGRRRECRNQRRDGTRRQNRGYSSASHVGPSGQYVWDALTLAHTAVGANPPAGHGVSDCGWTDCSGHMVLESDTVLISHHPAPPSRAFGRCPVPAAWAAPRAAVHMSRTPSRRPTAPERSHHALAGCTGCACQVPVRGLGGQELRYQPPRDDAWSTGSRVTCRLPTSGDRRSSKPSSTAHNAPAGHSDCTSGLITMRQPDHDQLLR